MREYHVWVMYADGAAGSIGCRAESFDVAAQTLAAQGYQLVPAAPHSERQGWTSRLARPSLRAAPRFDSLFAQQFQVLVRAGIGPVESLRALARHASGAYAAALAAIQAGIGTGRSLADSVAATERFDPLLVTLLGAAERTSDLDGALQRFLAHRQRTDALRQRVVTTAVYPTVLIAVGFAVLLLLLFHVVPRFSGIFASLGTDLPWAATLMLRWGVFLHGHAIWAVGMLAVVVSMLGLVLADRRSRAAMLRRVSRAGWLGQQIKLLQLCRYYRTISSLLAGGIALPQAMSMGNALLPEFERGAGEDALREVTEGRTLSDALSNSGLSTAVADQLMRVGQRTGQLGSMLERAADFHDEEVGRNIERFMRALEPTVMAVVGLAIGIIVVLMYLPIFELASAVR